MIAARYQALVKPADDIDVAGDLAPTAEVEQRGRERQEQRGQDLLLAVALGAGALIQLVIGIGGLLRRWRHLLLLAALVGLGATGLATALQGARAMGVVAAVLLAGAAASAALSKEDKRAHDHATSEP